MPADAPMLDLGLPAAPVKPAYVVLARKYRPQTFDDLIGQEAMVRTLRNAFASDRIAQAYMLTGVRGVGKTTTARILARALNYDVPGGNGRPSVDMAEIGRHCREIIESRHPDVLEMDAASNTGVDNIREIIESARYKPIAARIKVFIIDEVHMLSKGAFNALLKTLEEPPEHVKFVFATTEVRKVPVTVLSRCQRFDLRRVDVPELSAHLERIVAKEGAAADPDALFLIARAAQGSVRDALSLLDQAIAIAAGEASSPKIAVEAVRGMLGLADRSRVLALMGHLIAGNVKAVLGDLAALHRDGADPIEVLTDLAEAVHAVTRVRALGPEGRGEGMAAEETRQVTALSSQASIALLARLWQMLLKGIDEAERAPDARAAAEMVLIRIAYASDLPTPDDVIRVLGGAATTKARPAARTETSARGDNASTTGAMEPRPGPVASAPDLPPNPEADDPGFGTPSLDEADGDGLDDPTGEHRPSAAPELKTFRDVVDLVARRRDARLMVHLEEHVSLVRFDAGGSIELNLLPEAPKELANELREKLNLWSGRRWIVAVSRARGEKPIGVLKREAEAAEREALERHPAVRAVLEGFPDARIAEIRSIEPPAGEPETEGNDDAATG